MKRQKAEVDGGKNSPSIVFVPLLVGMCYVRFTFARCMRLRDLRLRTAYFENINIDVLYTHLYILLSMDEMFSRDVAGISQCSVTDIGEYIWTRRSREFVHPSFILKTARTICVICLHVSDPSSFLILQNNVACICIGPARRQVCGCNESWGGTTACS